MTWIILASLIALAFAIDFFTTSESNRKIPLVVVLLLVLLLLVYRP